MKGTAVLDDHFLLVQVTPFTLIIVILFIVNMKVLIIGALKPAHVEFEPFQLWW